MVTCVHHMNLKKHFSPFWDIWAISNLVVGKDRRLHSGLPDRITLTNTLENCSISKCAGRKCSRNLKDVLRVSYKKAVCLLFSLRKRIWMGWTKLLSWILIKVISPDQTWNYVAFSRVRADRQTNVHSQLLVFLRFYTNTKKVPTIAGSITELWIDIILWCWSSTQTENQLSFVL